MDNLRWSPQAITDLARTCEYIGQDSREYARLFAQRIVKLIESIPTHPLLGQVVPEYGREDLREKRFQSYRIVYRVKGEVVEVVSITHGGRLLPAAPSE
jgi:toxin ParE1/3/4